MAIRKEHGTHPVMRAMNMSDVLPLYVTNHARLNEAVNARSDMREIEMIVITPGPVRDSIPATPVGRVYDRKRMFISQRAIEPTAVEITNNEALRRGNSVPAGGRENR